MERKRRQAPRKPPQQHGRIGWWLLSLYLWGILGFILFKVDPAAIYYLGGKVRYLPLVLLFFGAVWATGWLIRRSWLKSLVWALAITGFVWLRLLGLGHVVNLLLIGGLLISAEYYWRVSDRRTTHMIDTPQQI